MVSCVLPKQIGCLIHLRYLAIRATNITSLPRSIGSLRNLQTLDYRDIHLENGLEQESIKVNIPNVFQTFVLLRHLYLPVEFPWSVQDLKLSSMKNLRTLWGVRLDDNSSYFLGEAPKLSTTLKKLKIVVSSENELKAAFCCPSLMDDMLHTFHCDMRDRLVLFNVEPLHARQHLLKLTLIGEIQIKLSLILPVNLVKLRLKDSMIKDADPMEALGALAHLKLLSLSNAYVGTTLSCGCGSFPLLEELSVESLSYLDTWNIHMGAMPCLKKLEIVRCWHLRNFPAGLNSVPTLEQWEFFDMPNDFKKQANACGWAPQKLRLPHNFASIIKHSDSPVDSSSISKLYEQLTEGIYLDNRTKKYWVAKQDGSYVNSFMVYALGLRLCLKQFGEVGSEGIEECCKEMKYCPHVEFREVIESPEVGIKVMVVKKPSILSGFFRVVGKFDLRNLSVEVAYQIYWLIMFEKSQYKGLYGRGRIYIDDFHGETTVWTTFNGRKMHREEIICKRLNEWIHIPGGEFKTDATMEAEVDLSLSYLEGRDQFDVVVKGFVIQPKA